jgi:hypothetical protein
LLAYRRPRGPRPPVELLIEHPEPLGQLLQFRTHAGALGQEVRVAHRREVAAVDHGFSFALVVGPPAV